MRLDVEVVLVLVLLLFLVFAFVFVLVLVLLPVLVPTLSLPLQLLTTRCQVLASKMPPVMRAAETPNKKCDKNSQKCPKTSFCDMSF